VNFLNAGVVGNCAERQKAHFLQIQNRILNLQGFTYPSAHKKSGGVAPAAVTGNVLDQRL
jgi:hypothetical protein